MLLRFERAGKRVESGTTIGTYEDSDIIATTVKYACHSIYTSLKRT